MKGQIAIEAAGYAHNDTTYFNLRVGWMPFKNACEALSADGMTLKFSNKNNPPRHAIVASLVHPYAPQIHPPQSGHPLGALFYSRIIIGNKLRLPIQAIIVVRAMVIASQSSLETYKRVKTNAGVKSEAISRREIGYNLVHALVNAKVSPMWPSKAVRDMYDPQSWFQLGEQYYQKNPDEDVAEVWKGVGGGKVGGRGGERIQDGDVLFPCARGSLLELVENYNLCLAV